MIAGGADSFAAFGYQFEHRLNAHIQQGVDFAQF